MADPEHVEILKQGVEVWNKWRNEHRIRTPELNHVDLNRSQLSGADLSSADLGGSNLCGADLSRADLSNSYIYFANLSDVNLFDAQFSGAQLRGSQLRRANLRNARFDNATLTRANLVMANLTGTDFSRTYLDGADFTGAQLGYGSFGDTELSQVKGLDTVKHAGPSTIGIDTIYKSHGNIPEVFLRGCGLSDWQIETVKLYQTELSNEEITNVLYRVHDLRAHQSIQISPLFISYSHADSSFVNKMETYLNEKGVRFWRDIHHSMAGRLEKQIDHAIRLNPTVLLILSSQSVKSDWVEHEARLARKLEQEIGRDVLCPIA